jgi:hypothetical protein
MILLHVTADLRNQPLKPKDQRLALLLFTLIPIFDDLMDDYQYTESEILKLVQKELPRQHLLEKVCIHLFDEIEKRTGQSVWSETWQKVLDAQLESQKQMNRNQADVDSAWLKQVSFDKGGFTLTLFLETVLPNRHSEAEKQAFYQLGAMIQLTNDIFDLYKDMQMKITTLVSHTQDMNAFRSFFETHLRLNLQMFNELPFPKANRDRFNMHYLFVIGLGLVALDPLQALQKTSQGKFQLPTYTRKQLICDMELRHNIIKWLQYVVQWAN